MRSHSSVVELGWTEPGTENEFDVEARVSLPLPRPRWAHPADPQFDAGPASDHVEILSVREAAPRGQLGAPRPDAKERLEGNAKELEELCTEALLRAAEREEGAREAAIEDRGDRIREERRERRLSVA